MVDTSLVSPNGGEPPAYPEADRRLSQVPESITMTSAEVQRVPSPGTQRALKAQTGRSYDELVGPDADGADRFQTFIWIKLRKSIEGLQWEYCADTEINIEDAEAFSPVDPTKLAAAATSPSSAASGE